MLGSLRLISHFKSITPRKKLPFLQTKKIKQIKSFETHVFNLSKLCLHVKCYYCNSQKSACDKDNANKV